MSKSKLETYDVRGRLSQASGRPGYRHPDTARFVKLCLAQIMAETGSYLMDAIRNKQMAAFFDPDVTQNLHDVNHLISEIFLQLNPNHDESTPKK